MIDEDVWVHIVEMRNKAHYLVVKLNASDDACKLASAADAIYYKYKEVYDGGEK